MRDIRMIVTDLDDTLLHTDKTVPERTFEALVRCRESGIKTAFATARGSSVHMLGIAPYFDAHITMNGAMARVDGMPVYVREIPVDVMTPFLKAMHAKGLNVTAEINERHYTNFDIHAMWPHIRDYERTDFDGLPGPAAKLHSPITAPAQIAILKRYLPDSLHMHTSKDNLAMIMHSEATKLCAVHAVAHCFGIAMEHVAAFGDDTNDIDVMKGCGVSVAVANALDAVKAVATYHTASNDEDGVARWIEDNILSN